MLKRNDYNAALKPVLLFICLFLLLCPGLQAADAGWPELKAAITRLKSLRSYRYETDTKVTFPDGKTDHKRAKVYMDAGKQRYCYIDRFQTLVLNETWAYKADHARRQASVFRVAAYNKKQGKYTAEISKLFASDPVAYFLDSLLLPSAHLAPPRNQGDLTTFTLTFAPDSYIEKVEIVYDNRRQLPESIRIVAFYPGATGSKTARGTRSETLSNHYATDIPVSVFDEKQYFKVVQGKVQLLQFKNYSLTTTL